MYKYIKKTFYEDSDFTITLEEADGNLMAHIAIYKFDKAIYRHILKLWFEIRYRAYCQGYKNIYTYSAEPRMFKFFKDGKEVGEFEKNGIKYGVWQWDLK